jgi:hypothetical protein
MKTRQRQIRPDFTEPLAGSSRWCLIALASFCICGAPARDMRADFVSLLEADWVAAARFHGPIAQSQALTPADDAAGGCDGLKDGTFGFHTDDADNPWWHVDLGSVQSLSRVRIWNRADAESAAARAFRLKVRLSADGTNWSTAYQHAGAKFLGVPDQKPLDVRLANWTARFVRVELPGHDYLHLDEVEVFGSADPAKNLALRRPANQISTSQWSRPHALFTEPDWATCARDALAYSRRLADDLHAQGRDVSRELAQIRQLASEAKSASVASEPRNHYLAARRIQRRLALANPLLDFDAILCSKRMPPTFNHMSDQYYGWWSQPGGGIYLLRGFKNDAPTTQCLTESFPHTGSFLRPTLSYDGTKVLFAWCRYYPGLADEADKLNKAHVPDDAFYHVFEMNLDGSNVRQLTHGKYDDFDARYLPDGRIVFLSTRRGQALQTGRRTARETLARPDLPDCYVRCGGGPERPVAVYTLHTMNADGSELCAISPFEMFEWTPEVAHDGSILYSRWDYIDRDNMPYMGLWAISPDGANARLVYGNYTKSPHCTFEPKPIPGSHKIVFTASAHHAQTMGSLVLLDPRPGTEGSAPLTRLTPEVPFPEIEAWPLTYYASPWPLSERFYLVAWGHEGATVPGPSGWNRWHAVRRPTNGLALYLFDAAGGRELLYGDAQIACSDPIPVRARPRPSTLASPVNWDGPAEGRFLLADVYQGLQTVARGDIKALRIVAVPAKTHPTMNFPNLGVTRDDPGKCVLGTVPVADDGSAHFRVPAGVIVFFQALDACGLAVQTMRSATHVQPGQTLSCIGCHESRLAAPPVRPPLAAAHEPSKILLGPEGSWSLRFDRLVQPVLDQHCVSCHRPDGEDKKAAQCDLTAVKAYDTLVQYGKPSLQDQVWAGYRQGFSIEGEGVARRSALLALLTQPGGHENVKLNADSLERLIVWMDTYAQRAGVFSEDQERQLEALRRASADLLIERSSGKPSRFVQHAPR